MASLCRLHYRVIVAVAKSCGQCVGRWQVLSQGQSGAWRVFGVNVVLDEDGGKDVYEVSDAVILSLERTLSITGLRRGAPPAAFRHNHPDCKRCRARCATSDVSLHHLRALACARQLCRVRLVSCRPDMDTDLSTQPPVLTVA